jgi:PAS domain S-box-containing protein
LLVEDNPGDARLLRETLADAGMTIVSVVHVTRLREAHARLAREHFDVVLLDLSLPDADGLETIVRTHEYAPCVPIVVLTGTDDEDLAVKAVRGGAQDYLVKGQGDGHLLVRAIRYAIERKRAEEVMARREEYFRSLIENALDIITTLSDEGAIRYASPAVERVLGYRPEELTGQSIFAFVPADDAAGVRDLLNARRHTGAAISSHFRFRHNNGSWAVLEAIGKHYIDDGGLPGVIINAREVTERKLAEEQLRQALETLRAVIETSPLAIYTLDRERRVKSWNPAAERIFGWSKQDILDSPLPTIHPDDWTETMEQFRRLMRGETLAGSEARRQRKDGKVIQVNIWTASLRGPLGEVTGVVAVVADITDQQRLEEQLRLSQRMEAVGRLAGGIAHDFNNLLTIMTGYTDLLLDRIRESDPLRRNVEEIKGASSRAAALTNQLLAFSRKHVLQPKILDLNEIVSDMDKMLRRLIGEDIELIVALAPNVGAIRGDPGQIEQVIVNLVVNAREAMPQGGRLIVETANLDLDDEYTRQHVGVEPGCYIMLAVSDTGVGMDSETLAHIFEPFFTTKGNGKGTGLGLSTVYGIVRQSGGNIWVYSEPARGSSFKIYFPRVDGQCEEREMVAPPAGRARGTETVLLAEDDETVRGLVREVLQQRGYLVLEARNGMEALEMADGHNGRIDLLVTDVIMPHMSGRELVERLRPLHPETRILFMSGYTDNAVVPQVDLAPGTEFLQKPFAPENLARKVREVLDAENRDGR